LKILHVIYDDRDNPWCGGGGARRVYEIYKRLSGKHRIIVVTGNYPGARNETIEGIRFLRVGLSGNYWLSRISFTMGIPFAVRKQDFDILINDFSLFSPCFADLYTKKPVVNIIHHIAGSHALRKYPLIGIFSYVAEKIVLKLSKNIITVSQSVLKKVKSHNKKAKLTCIHNGIDESYFQLKKREQNFLLFIGRIDIYMKGLDLLLKSFKYVVKEFNAQYTLLIAGRGKKKDLEELKEQAQKLAIKDSIEFLGEVSEETKESLLSDCLFLCMPSRFEGWGITAIEAAAAGKPTVGTKIDGLMDAVINGKTGILVEPENCEEFSKNLIRLIRDRELRKKMGESAREWAYNFNWDSIASQQEDFYKEINKINNI